MEWIIDRIEEDIAVVECNGHRFNVPLSVLPPDIKEGDTVHTEKNDSNVKGQDARNLMNRVFKKH